MTLLGTMRVRSGPGDAWVRCGAALVSPDAPHEVDARDRPVLLAFVEAESELGNALREKCKGPITRLGPHVVNRWRCALGSSPLQGSQVERWVREELLTGGKAPQIHPGVSRVLEAVRERLATEGGTSQADLARIAGLSLSRFGHVFSESVGVSLRPYLLWLRLQRACGELMSGANATEAAHNAGFSDAAHMARTFRRMLGASPTELMRRAPETHGVAVQSRQ